MFDSKKGKKEKNNEAVSWEMIETARRRWYLEVSMRSFGNLSLITQVHHDKQ